MTVADLNVGIGGNPAGLINALNASTQAINQFAVHLNQLNSRVSTSLSGVLGRVASAMSGNQAQFRSAGAAAGAQFTNSFQASVPPAAFQAASARAAAQLRNARGQFTTAGVTSGNQFTNGFTGAVPPATFQQAGARAAKGFTSGFTPGIQQGLFSLRNALATLGISLGVRELVQYADTWKLVEARLGTVINSTTELRRVQDELFKISQDTRSEFEANATLFQRLAQSQRNLGITSRETISITRTVAQALAIEGRSIQEVSSTIRQLGQAFASGRFQGDELRSVSENASLLFQKIADNLGVTIGQLRTMASENKVAVADVARAILAAGADIEKQANKLPTTVGGAFVQLRNSVQRFIGETDRALGITTRLVAGINALGRQFDRNRAAVETFAFALGAGGLVLAVNAAIRALGILSAIQVAQVFLGIGAALGPVVPAMLAVRVAAVAMWSAITGPIGLAIIGLTALTVAFFKWRKGIQDAKTATAEFEQSLRDLEPTELNRKMDETLRRFVFLKNAATTLQQTLARQQRPATPIQTEELNRLNKEIQETTQTFNTMVKIRDEFDALNKKTDIVPPGGTDAVKDFAEQTSRMIAVFQDMKVGGQQVAGVVDRLRERFDEAQRTLRGIKDPFSEQAVRLRKTIQELADLPEIKLRLRVDTTTRELTQMTQKEVDKILATNVPALTVRPIIDTSLGNRQIVNTAEDTANLFKDRFTRTLGKIQFDVLRDRLKASVGSVPIVFEPAGMNQLEQAVGRAVAAQNRLNLARIGGDRTQIVAAEGAYKVALDQTRASMESLARAVDDGTVKSVDQANALNLITQSADKLGITLNRAVAPLDRLINVSRAATGIARGLLGIADAAKSISDEMRKALGDAVNLFDSITDLAQAQKDLRGGTGNAFTVATSALGVSGAGLSLVNSVVAAIQADNEKLRQVIREQTEIQRENNRNLDQLRIEVEGFTGSIADLRRAAGAIRGPLDPTRGGSIGTGFTTVLQLIQRLAEIQRKADSAPTQNILRGVLSEFGTSLAELNAIANDLGITLFDQAGRIIPDAFELLADSIDLQIKALTRFGNTLDDQRTKLDLEADVFDFAQSAQTAIDQGLTLLGRLAPNLFEQFFGNINPADAAAVEQALRALTSVFLNNVELIEDQFGDLFGKDDLIEIIRLVEQGLDGLADAANSVTASLLNVPTGFRIERARFEATAVEVMNAVKESVVRGGLAPLPPTVVLPDRTSVTAIDQAGVGGGDTINIYGDILVDAREKPDDELVAGIKSELKRQARGQGLTTRPSTMLDF